MGIKHILFVCTGNSCRSVMAQRLLQRRLQQGGLDAVTVSSAGVFAIEGMAATPQTQRVLQGVGLDATGHVAHVVTPEMVQEADLIFAMEELHQRELLQRFPGAKDKVHLLKPYGVPRDQQDENPNIPDPIGKPMEVYEVCFGLIREAVARVAQALGIAGP